MRIQLVNGVPAEKRTGGEIDAIYPPLGLLYLASYSRACIQNLNFKVTDGNLVGYEKTIKEIERFQPDIIGMSISSFGIIGAYRLMNYIKNKYPEIFIIAGGPQPTSLPEEVMKKGLADAVVVGEGEVAFKELIEYKINKIKKLKDIKGILFKKNKNIYFTGKRKPIKDLDSIPFPARDLIDIRKYPGFVVVKRLPETYIISSRGCPYNCMFCSNPIWKASKPFVRLRNPDKVSDEIEELVHNYGIKEFYDQCDEFNPTLNWSKKICDEYIKRKIDIPWKVQLKADKIDEELVRKMSKAGCWLVSLGIESGNQQTLNGIEKNINLDQVVRACQLFKKHEIKVFGLFMMFNFWEKSNKLIFEDVRKTKNTLNFAKKLIEKRLLDYISWSFTTPYPGSKIYSIAKKHEILSENIINEEGLIDWNATWKMPVKLPGISEDEALQIKKDGSKIQARCLLKSRNINKSLVPLYFRRGVQVSKLELRNLVERLS